MTAKSSTGADGSSDKPSPTGSFIRALGYRFTVLDTEEFNVGGGYGDTWMIGHSRSRHSAIIKHGPDGKWAASVYSPYKHRYFRTLKAAEKWVEAKLRFRAKRDRRMSADEILREMEARRKGRRR